VCRIAFDTRLRTTRASSGSLPSTTGAVAALASTRTRLRFATGVCAASTSETTSRSATCDMVSTSAPAVIRDSSNRSSTMPESRRLSPPIWFA
jgi:hypothetical protein